MATAAQAIQAAEERLESALFGLDDMKTRKERFQSGFRNAVVFGRMVTFSLQTMRNEVPRFNAWYDPKKEEMKADPLIRFFNTMRTEIEKEAKRQIGVSTYIHSWNAGTAARLGPAPPGAHSFFMGDPDNGGSGWMLTNSDGSTEKYYTEIPPEIGEVKVLLLDAPKEFEGVPAEKLLERYLGYMSELLSEAKRQFANVR
jgi:hypothetical protein